MSNWLGLPGWFCLFSLNCLLCVEAIPVPGPLSGEKAPQEKRRVTVADTIGMTRWSNRKYFLGGSPDAPVGIFSPDTKHFLVVVKKGNLGLNTTESSVLLFQTGGAMREPKPKTILTFSSSSNRDAITDVRWLADNETVIFLGGNPGEATQVYSFNLRTSSLTKLTSHATSVVSYAISNDGQRLLYEADPLPVRSISSAEAERNGVVITTEYPSDLLASACGPERESEVANKELFVQKNGQVSVKISSVDFLTDYLPLSLSPNGRYALLEVYMQDIPAIWSEYEDNLLRPYLNAKQRPGVPSNIQRYMLLDLGTLELSPLLNSPMSWFNSGFAWAGDGNSLAVSGTYLPLEGVDTGEREIRKKHTFVVELQLPSRKIVKITDEEVKIVKWEQETGRLYLKSGYWWKDTVSKAYRKQGSQWNQVPVTAEGQKSAVPLNVTLEEGVNAPPEIFASTWDGRQKVLLLDLNPQFSALQFGKVEPVTWKATDGHEVVGGLYLPPDYAPGKRYPLVLQTHGFNKDRFWIDGPWNSAFAAQPLAAAGVVVLQVGGAADIDEDLKVSNTPKEGPREMAAYEGAIDYLDARGLIDRSRVGIIGFSRTVYYVAFTLTHSKYPFAAATLADGFDGGYVNYMVWGGGPDYAGVNGGTPVGASLKRWLESSPGFNLDKVSAPVRLEYYGRAGVLGGWQWYSGLQLLNKPVEFTWLPYGTHLLVKPWERLTSQQGNVDWFVFWLKGDEDPDPAKAEQYKRWRELRKLQEANEATQHSN